MQTRSRRRTVVIRLAILGAIVLAVVVGLALWTDVFAATREGVIVDKTVVKGTGTESEQYVLVVRLQDGTMQRVAVPDDVYKDVSANWPVKIKGRSVLAKSPDGTRQVMSGEW